jgi:hypothetical protein
MAHEPTWNLTPAERRDLARERDPGSAPNGHADPARRCP